MLTKYDLVNVPEGGVDHLVESRRYSINDQLTDQDAEVIINAGLGHYFKSKPTKTDGTKEGGKPTNK